MNTTNCWSNLVFYFTEKLGAESITLSGDPLACDVTNPVVKFQYQKNGKWIGFIMIGDSSYGADYYDKTSNFVFMNVKNYK